MMTPQGNLAAEPALIEASASEKGLLLMRSAISVLQACRPYAALPVDRYANGRYSTSASRHMIFQFWIVSLFGASP